MICDLRHVTNRQSLMVFSATSVFYSYLSASIGLSFAVFWVPSYSYFFTVHFVQDRRPEVSSQFFLELTDLPDLPIP